MKIQESAENYLEAILELQEEQGLVRSIDVVQRLNVSKPSVSRAMGLLRENGYLTMSRDGALHLTDSGQTIAARIYERHRLITRWLTDLGVSPQVAATDACRMEHAVSEETFEKLKLHFSQFSPDASPDSAL